MTPTLFVTDTHPLVWWASGQGHKLSRKAFKAFESAVEGTAAIMIPLVVLWELSSVVKSGRVRIPLSLEEYVQEKFFARAISILAIETEDILLSHQLNFTNDPFDTLIVAMTMRMGCPLITGDSIIHKTKPCPVFW